jgi:predicted ATP-grasp superfamily ATP-dependent carboligase
VVVKPRDGAGSQAIQLCCQASDPLEFTLGRNLAPTDRLLVQEYVPGLAASVACLIGPVQTISLVPCQQVLSADGRFRYLGGRMPIAPKFAARASRIAAAAIQCVPGLLGYVGVDVVLGDDGRDWAIEINPRLTTSYVGLRALARFNLAAAMLCVVRGERAPAPAWHTGPIQFAPDGEIWAP